MKFLLALACLANVIRLSQQYDVWKQYKNDTFLFIQTPKTFELAVNHCTSLNMMLAKIADADVNEFVKETISQISQNFWFIGVNAIKVKHQFVNADDTPLGFHNWFSGEPDNYGDEEDCVIIGGHLGVQWADISCGLSHHFICQGVSRELEDVYKFYQGHIYVFVLHGLNYNAKIDYCKSLKMTLTGIDSSQQETWLRSTGSSVESSANWMTGGNDIKTEGKFVNTDGSQLSYANWHMGEPNGLTDENCVGFWKSLYKWVDLNCDNMIPFICRGSYIEVHKRYNDDEFAIIRSPKEYIAAQFQCNLLGKKLTKIENANVNTFLWNIVMKIWSTNWYIGLNDIEQEGNFVNADGTTLSSYTKWGSGHPISSSSTNCVTLYQLYWNNLPCTDKHPFICLGVPQNDSTKYYEGQKYVFVLNGMDYLKNTQYCNYMSLNLASVKDSFQLEWLWRTGSSLQPLTAWMIGANDMEQDGVFINADGSQLVSGHWYEGEVTVGNLAENCSGILPDGTLFDTSCARELSFICQGEIMGLIF